MNHVGSCEATRGGHGPVLLSALIRGIPQPSGFVPLPLISQPGIGVYYEYAKMPFKVQTAMYEAPSWGWDVASFGLSGSWLAQPPSQDSVPSDSGSLQVCLPWLRVARTSPCHSLNHPADERPAAGLRGTSCPVPSCRATLGYWSWAACCSTFQVRA